MEWIKLPENMHNARSHFPLDRQFIAIWRGMPGICQYDDDEDTFYFSNQPSYYCVMRIDRERECKFTHWCDIQLPNDK